MEPKKLQLYITITQSDGMKTVVEANSDEYVKSWVYDLRDVVKKVDYPKSQKNIFFMVKYIDQGMFVTIIRTIPQGAPADHLAAWIFVPYSIELSDADLCAAVKMITGKVSNEAVSGKDVGEMRAFFNRSYEDNLLAPIFASSAGLNYAYRYYGAGLQTLQELLGPHRYQPAYLPFAGVLLIDNGITSDVNATNLTAAPLDTMGVLLPPPAVDGYKPMIYDEDFDMPYFAPMSRKFDIVWHKPGEPDHTMSITLTKPRMQAPALVLQAPEQQMPAKPASPQAQGAKPRFPWEDPEQKPIPASEPRAWDSNPAAPAEKKPTEKKPEEPVRVVAKPTSDVPDRQKTYHFEIPAKSAKIGTIIEFVITTDSPISESPIDGYEADTIHEGAGHSNRLHYKDENPYSKYMVNALYALGGLLVGVVMTLLITCAGGHSKKATAEPADTTTVEQQTPAEQPAAQPVAPTQPEQNAKVDETPMGLIEACNYLDSNSTWAKAEMEKYPDLKGLYDDMVNVRHDRIIDFWGPKLKESRRFTNNVVKHTKQAKDIKKKPTKVPLTTGDSFGVQAYLNNVDPAQPKKSK